MKPSRSRRLFRLGRYSICAEPPEIGALEAVVDRCGNGMRVIVSGRDGTGLQIEFEVVMAGLVPAIPIRRRA